MVRKLTEDDWKIVEARLETDIEMEKKGLIPKLKLIILEGAN